MKSMVLPILLMLTRGLVCITRLARFKIDWLRYVEKRLQTACALGLRRSLGGHARRYWRVVPALGMPRRFRAKPVWVQREVLRLKALMPHSGCRKIADCFNRRFEPTRQMTVGKSYVSDTIRQHYYEITVLRRQIKNAEPKVVPRNLVWALDLTAKPRTTVKPA